MDSFFSIQVTTLAQGLAAALGVALLVVALMAWRRRLLLRLALRNIPRRRTQVVLIVAGLMLSAMLVSLALATGDTLAGTLRTQVLLQTGRTDEIVTAPGYAYFPYDAYTGLAGALRGNPDVAAVAPMIARGSSVVADLTARQIKSGVTVLGAPSSYSPVFGRLLDAGGRPVSLQGLASDEAYANAALAKSLDAGAGHRLYLFLDGRRVALRLRAVAQPSDLTGTQPTLLLPLAGAQAIMGQPGRINRIVVANSGTPLTSVDRSDAVAAAVLAAPANVGVAFSVNEVRQDETRTVQRAQDIFWRIFTLFTLFAISISLLLIFLIFTMLAAERRSETGVTRALGAQRTQVVAAFVFEGVVYDIVASLIGLGAGIGLGVGVMALLGTIFARFDVPIPFVMTRASMVIAYALGALCTLAAVVASSVVVSRLNLVAAMRGLPDAPEPGPTLAARTRQLARALRHYGRMGMRGYGRAALYAAGSAGAALLALLWGLVTRGPLLLAPGFLLAGAGIDGANLTTFSAGVVLLSLAAGLLLRWTLRLAGHLYGPLGRLADRAGYSLAGLALLLYWALPIDTLQGWGLPRFGGGVEIFFLAGVMMVAGAVWVAVYNVGMLLRPLDWTLMLMGRAALALRTAVAYPLHHTFRTGMTLALFALVVFTLTVMSVIANASQDTYSNPNAMGNGFNIQAHTIYSPVPNIREAMASSTYVRPGEFAAVGTQAYVEVGVVQLSAPRPGWSVYAASMVNRDFLRGTRIALGTRARGYRSDADVWRAVAAHPDLAVIDSQALLSRNGYASQPLPGAPAGAPQFVMSGVYQEDTTMEPAPLWIAAGNGGRAFKVTVIGVIDSRAYQTYGLFVDEAALRAAGAPIPQPTSYYFRAAPGRDPLTEARRLEAAFLDHGLEAVVTSDDILLTQGPRMLVSGLLQGFVGLTLLMGVVALGLVAARSVVERRQQIGMLRALGYPRGAVGLSLLLEASFVALLGSAVGVALGLLLCRNLFASNFFEQYKTGMVYAAPWAQLGVVVAIAYGASMLTTLVPAWQATRIVPAEALRYSD